MSETKYDEKGRIHTTVRHNIDAADGSDDDNLEARTWYDAAGRVVKVDGEQLTKTVYDGLGRATHQFILASHDDIAYADAADVTGDIILAETQTTFDSDNSDVLMTANISRLARDTGMGETTGALDSNADVTARGMKATRSSAKRGHPLLISA